MFVLCNIVLWRGGARAAVEKVGVSLSRQVADAHALPACVAVSYTAEDNPTTAGVDGALPRSALRAVS